MVTRPKAANHGRPRLLTHEEILDGAVAIGLENLTLKKLADHLGVGTATLYQYFDSRKALMRAAAVHALSDVSLPEDTGQHWSLLARDYVIGIMTLLSDNPTYMNSMSPTDYGFEVQFKLIEPFLASMARRGIAPEDSMDLFNQIGLIAYGGAVEAARQREFEFQDETMFVVARRQFDRLNVDEFPHMAKVMDVFTQTPEAKVDTIMRSTFKSFARQIGQGDEQILSED